MGIASVVHLYVFPAKPYLLLGNHRSPENISVLGDYAATDPVDPDEIKDISRPTKLRLPQLEPDEIIVTNVKESVRDFVIGSGEYVSSCKLVLPRFKSILFFYFFTLHKIFFVELISTAFTPPRCGLLTVFHHFFLSASPSLHVFANILIMFCVFLYL